MLIDSTIDSNRAFFSKFNLYLNKMKPSFENLEHAKLNVAGAIQLSQSSFSNEKSSIISFPPPPTQSHQFKPSIHQQVCNILIRHKEILNLISQIDNTNDPIQSIISLERYNELAYKVRLVSQFF
jgi:hypothetical protein